MYVSTSREPSCLENWVQKNSVSMVRSLWLRLPLNQQVVQLIAFAGILHCDTTYLLHKMLVDSESESDSNDDVQYHHVGSWALNKLGVQE